MCLTISSITVEVKSNPGYDDDDDDDVYDVSQTKTECRLRALPALNAPQNKSETSTDARISVNGYTVAKQSAAIAKGKARKHLL